MFKEVCHAIILFYVPSVKFTSLVDRKEQKWQMIVTP